MLVVVAEALHSKIADMKREHAATVRRLEEEKTNLKAQLIDSEATGAKRLMEANTKMDEALAQYRTADQQLQETRQMLVRYRLASCNLLIYIISSP